MRTASVLILSGSSGAGHVVTAQAVAEELQDEGVPAVHRDAYDFVSPLSRWAYVHLHARLVEFLPNAYGAVYERGNRSRPLVAAHSLASIHSRAVFATALEQLRPSVVLATHALGVQLAGALRRRASFRLVALTPNFCAHAFHVHSAVDLYCASHPLVVADLTSAGVPPARIRLTGVPLRRQFDHPPHQADARAVLGLPLDCPIIVVSRGGTSAGRETMQLIEALLAARELTRCHVVVIVGSVQHAYLQARQRFAGHSRVRVVGYVQDVAPYFASADVVIGKAAGVTCAEVFTVGRPLVIFAPIRGPESANVDRLVRAGAVVNVGRDPQAAVQAVGTLLSRAGRVAELIRSARSFVIPESRQMVLRALLEAHARTTFSVGSLVERAAPAGGYE